MTGRLVTDDAGDSDSDGFNEIEGCYVLASAAQGVKFTLHGAEGARMNPAFKVREWEGEAPASITCGKKTLATGKDFNAAVKDGVLLLRILRKVAEDAGIGIAVGK